MLFFITCLLIIFINYNKLKEKNHAKHGPITSVCVSKSYMGVYEASPYDALILHLVFFFFFSFHYYFFYTVTQKIALTYFYCHLINLLVVNFLFFYLFFAFVFNTKTMGMLKKHEDRRDKCVV